MMCATAKNTGAPVAQNKCAAAGFAYRKYSLAQKRATGAFATAQHQQSEFFQHGKSNGNRGNAAAQQDWRKS